MSVKINPYWTDLESYHRLTGGGPGLERLVFPDSGEDDSALSRRHFLKLGGLAAVVSMVGCAQRPAEKIIPYVNRPEDYVPGVASYYASTCCRCAAGCGMVYRVREGRPVKAEGNSGHPVNSGTLCARGQATLFDLYDPDRLRKPLVRDDNGTWQENAFAEADKQLAGKLANVRGEVVLLTGPWHGPAREALAERFLSGFPQASHVRFDPLADNAFRDAAGRLYGGAVQACRYCFDRARHVLLLGSDPFANGPLRMKYLRDWASLRSPGNDMSRMVAFEPVLSESGAMADERFPVAGRDLDRVAGALAHILLLKMKTSPLAADENARRAVEGFDPDETENSLGLPQGTLSALAEELRESRGEALVVSESFAGSHPGAGRLHTLTLLLNEILSAPGNTLEWAGDPVDDGHGAMLRLIRRMESGSVGAVIVAGVNPAYQLPASAGFGDAFAGVRLRVSLATGMDETAELCNFVLPGLHGAESWNDSRPLPGVISIQQPVISPLWENRQAEQTLLSLRNILDRDASSAGGEGSTEKWSDRLRAWWRENIYPRIDTAASFEAFWTDTLKRGYLTLPGPGMETANPAPDTTALGMLAEGKGDEAKGLELRLTASSIHQDGGTMNNAWLLELPDPVTRITWDNFISLAPETALGLGLREGEIVSIETGAAEALRAPVHIQPGMAAGCVSLALGWGRNSAGSVGDGVGVNAFGLVRVEDGKLSYSTGGVSLAATGERARLACVQGSDSTHGRPIVFHTTLEEYVENPSAGQFGHAGHGGEVEPHLEEPHGESIWREDHHYPGHLWGMAIDLNRCTGCGACMVACQVENNIPPVGRSEVLNGRELHWMRIDRYYHGELANPKVLYQPMLCQQCDNAPCETVCPVIATMHNDEGLNVQLYNRCVGTRYCSNNCPYKARRFNWHEYALEKYRQPLNLPLNPDVTVREKGVMEKCTFCIQRIREARYRAKDRGTPVRDGEIVPACVQTCPTGALVFGDLNDPDSRVARLTESGRSFHSLEELNTRPSVSYLTLVRNRRPGEEGSHGHG